MDLTGIKLPKNRKLFTERFSKAEIAAQEELLRIERAENPTEEELQEEALAEASQEAADAIPKRKPIIGYPAGMELPEGHPARQDSPSTQNSAPTPAPLPAPPVQTPGVTQNLNNLPPQLFDEAQERERMFDDSVYDLPKPDRILAEADYWAAKALYIVCPETGHLISRKTGRYLRSMTSDRRYLTATLNGKRYIQAKIIWLLWKGEWPTEMVRYRDGRPANTKPNNLILQTEMSRLEKQKSSYIMQQRHIAYLDEQKKLIEEMDAHNISLNKRKSDKLTGFPLIEELRKYYMLHEGVLRFKKNGKQKKFSKKPIRGKIYYYLAHKGYEYPAPKCIWALKHGEWPTGRMVFLDGNSDNLHPDNIHWGGARYEPDILS